MGNLRDRFLQRSQGFRDGDGVRDSAVYLDGHTLYVEVMGDGSQGTSPAFVVRGLNNDTNAPTELLRINKDGSIPSLNLSHLTLSSSTLINPVIDAASILESTFVTGFIGLDAANSAVYIGTNVRSRSRDIGSQVFNILGFGATAGPSFNNFSAITAAASAAYGATGGIVYVPGGRWLTQPFEIGNRVSVRGAGMLATELVLIASQSNDFVTNHQSTGAADPNGKFITVADLTLNGNKASQASGHGIFWKAPTPGSEPAADDSSDSHNTVVNVRIANAKQTGWTCSGGSENRFINVHSEKCDDDGAEPGYDTWATDCTAEKSGRSGFLIRHGSVRGMNLKAFYSGTRTFSSNGHGAGFFMLGAGGDGIVKLTNCEAQDNSIHGFAINSSRHVSMTNCAADSNGWGAAGSLAAPGTFMAIDTFDAAYCNITAFTSVDRAVDHGAGARITQKNALRMRGSAGGSLSVYNYVQGTHAAMVAASDASMGPPVATINNTVNSQILFNGNTVASAVVSSGSANLYTT